MAIVELDGELWDAETGEYAGPASSWIDGGIDSEDKALQYLRRRMELEAQLNAKIAQLEAVKANVEDMVKQARTRLDWWDAKYKADLGSWVWDTLPRKADGEPKTKTWTTPYGKVSFRTSAPKIEIRDEDKAVSFAEDNCPSSIKVTKKVLVSQIPPVVRDWLMRSPEDAEDEGFGILPGVETMTIKAGME